VDFRIGCVGYSYDFWVGPFYPRHTPSSEFLRLYGKVFDLVEIDNTFYRSPKPEVAAEWRDDVPDGFRFALKFPRKITHELLFTNADKPQEWFFAAIERLKPKVGPLVLQLPPSASYAQLHGPLFEFLDGLPKTFRYAVEFRHGSWMQPAVFRELGRRDVALVWNEIEYVDTAPELTTDFVYLRFIGDRSLTALGSVKIDRTAEMTKWAARLKEIEGRVGQAFVLFNNHFAGYGPACADAFRGMLGMPRVDFAAIHTPQRGQRQLGEYG